MNTPILELKQLSFDPIFSNIDLSLQNNEFLSITGKNGTGKTLLGKIIAGLERPTSGTIRLKNQDITALDIPARARLGLAYAFQSPIRFRGLKIQELLDISAHRALTPEEQESLLAQVGLDAREYAHRDLDDKLSGGEAKRLELAMLLARPADLLILDEPEAGIDLWSLRDLENCLKSLKQQGKTLLVISHAERLLRLADRTLLLKNGKLEDYPCP